MEFVIDLLFQLVLNVPILRTIVFAIIPALLLLLYVRSKDRLEPESPQLIWSLVGLGAAAMALAFVLEMAGLFVLSKAVDPYSPIFPVLQMFLAVGLVEEGSKYLMLRLRTWKNPEFDCLFDGLVYAVAVSAGFALVENLLYLFRYGPSVVFMRAVVSIPGHICFSIFMGAWYSAAKKYEAWGDSERMRRSKALAIAVPAIAHGAFDLLAINLETPVWIVVFILFVVAMFIVSWRIMKKLSEKDAYYRYAGHEKEAE